MTKAQSFVPSAVEKARQIKNQMIQLQSSAAALRAEYLSLGGEAMDGLDTFDFTAYPFTIEEFKAAMTDVGVAHNAVALTTIYSSLAFDDVTKIAVG
jgi:hypothetical protein